jgi:hypothetical protein
MKYPKHLLVIKDKVMNIGNNITIEEDIDASYITMTFELPYIKTDNFDTTDIKKYDNCELYFAWFNSTDERDAANTEDMHKVITGYIDSFTRSESKDTGIVYNITVKSTWGLAYERSSEIKYFTGTIPTIIDHAIQNSSLAQYIHDIDIRGISENLVINVDSSIYLGEVFKKMSEDYIFKVYQINDGTLRVWTPTYFISNNNNVHQYDLTQNVFNIDYGDGQNNIDCVIVYGTNVSGVAFDPIAYMLKNQSEVIPTPQTIDQGKLNPLKIERRDLYSEEDCQKVAREKLVELARNYTITLTVDYDPTHQLGDMFVIKNSKIVPEEQKWIIKKRTVTISKEDISCSIVAYSNSVTDFPDDILISSTGILDTDMLEITDKVTPEY